MKAIVRRSVEAQRDHKLVLPTTHPCDSDSGKHENQKRIFDIVLAHRSRLVVDVTIQRTEIGYSSHLRRPVGRRFIIASFWDGRRGFDRDGRDSCVSSGGL